MSTDVTKIIGGPAIIQFAGASFYSKGDIVLENLLETFNIEVDRYRKVDERVKEQPIRLRFTPCGEWENLAVLFPYAATILGDLVTPVRTVASVVFASDYVTLNGEAPVNGQASQIAVSTGGTLPAGLTALTTYFLGLQTGFSDRWGFYNTRANAIAGGATGRVDITDAGTGTFKVIRQEPLVIWTLDGTVFTFHNAAVVQMPGIVASTVETLLGEVVFEAFLKNGVNWSAANSRFTISSAALADTTFDPAAILTQSYTMAWGAAPWDALSTKNGVRVDFGMQLEAVETDTDGVLTRRLAGLEVSAKATPVGITETQLMTALLLQDTGARRGRSISGENLNLSATGVYVRLYGAALKGGQQLFSSKLDRVGDLTWIATRTFSGGAPNPLFFVGTAAPS